MHGRKRKKKNFVEEFRRQNQTQDNKAQADFLREFVAEFRRQSISEAEKASEIRLPLLVMRRALPIAMSPIRKVKIITGGCLAAVFVPEIYVDYSGIDYADPDARPIPRDPITNEYHLCEAKRAVRAYERGVLE